MQVIIKRIGVKVWSAVLRGHALPRPQPRVHCISGPLGSLALCLCLRGSVDNECRNSCQVAWVETPVLAVWHGARDLILSHCPHLKNGKQYFVSLHRIVIRKCFQNTAQHLLYEKLSVRVSLCCYLPAKTKDLKKI